MTDNPRVAGPGGPATTPTTSARGGTAGAAAGPAATPGTSAGGSTAASGERVVIKDNRKIDANGASATGTANVSEQGAAPGSASSADEAAIGAETARIETPEPDDAATAGTVEGEVIEQPGKAGESHVGAPALGAELEALRTELEERTQDLQRVTAEYANYRKRVDRDRALVVEQATGNVLGALLPVLDDLDRAREHGDLVGPFGAVAEQLTAALTKFGLTAFGAKGDPFDPTRHEAVAHLTSAEVSEATCVDVMRRGYLLGERLLRPALVAVADPE